MIECLLATWFRKNGYSKGNLTQEPRVGWTETGHSVQWEQAAVIKTEKFITKRKVQETLQLEQQTTT